MLIMRLLKLRRVEICAMVRLKICLLASNLGPLDEGMRKVVSRNFWEEIRFFKPDIVHYVTGPSILSFIIMKVVKLYYPNLK